MVRFFLEFFNIWLFFNTFFRGAPTFIIITREWQNRFIKTLLFLKANEYIYNSFTQSLRFNPVV